MTQSLAKCMFAENGQLNSGNHLLHSLSTTRKCASLQNTNTSQQTSVETSKWIIKNLIHNFIHVRVCLYVWKLRISTSLCWLPPNLIDTLSLTLCWFLAMSEEYLPVSIVNWEEDTFLDSCPLPWSKSWSWTLHYMEGCIGPCTWVYLHCCNIGLFTGHSYPES